MKIGMEKMKKLFSEQNIRQFFSYFVVGGIAALTEWICFFLLVSFAAMPYLAATVIAFLASTTVNWYLGRTFTFKNSRYNGNQVREVFLVFLVSAVGLGFNLALMVIFVAGLNMSTTPLKTMAKIIATGMVFIWNYLSRKIFIYKPEPKPKKQGN